MSTTDFSKEIRSLTLSYPLYSKNIDGLSESDFNILSDSYSIFKSYYKKLLNIETDPRITDIYSFHQYVNPSEIEKLINKLFEIQSEETEEQKKEIKERPDQASIPPDLESLVAEYQQNQILLQEEEIKSNGPRSVARQVEIAIAHTKIKNLALANKERRQLQKEVFQRTEKAFTKLGSPKSENISQALESSYKAAMLVAFTYENFSKLPKDIQNQIISTAVELNTIGVTDIDIAIQASTLQIDTTNIDEQTKSMLSTIPGGFISSVYKEIVKSNQTIDINLSKISTNEEKIIQLEKENKTEEIKLLVEENQHLITFNENQSTRLSNSVSKQTQTFENFKKNRESRLSKDPDLKDLIEDSNKAISSIHKNFKINGVKPHLYTPVDDADQLEQAIRHDLPGTLRPNAGYRAEYAAALIDTPLNDNLELSPQAILLAGKGLTPKLLSKARLLAKTNPESSLGKLFQKNKGVFDTIGNQVRKISKSPLGKEITVVTSRLGKVFKGFSGYFRKISDKVPGGLGNAFRVIQDPIGALKSWTGKKVGKYVAKKILASTAGKAATEAGKKIAGELLKKGIGKAVASIVTKLGLEAALASTGVGAPVAIVLLVIDVAVSLLKAAKNAIQKVAKSIYGEEIKTKDLLIAPVIAFSGVASGVGSFFAGIGTATVAATSSAIGIVVASIFVGVFFYITSIAVAPLISTLVQLESTTPTGNYGDLNFDCGPDAGAEILVEAGNYSVSKILLNSIARQGLCITPTKITIHWSGGWSSNDITRQVLEARGLSCQIGTDQDGSVQQWQQMYENKAELAWCTGGNENNYCLNNEMVGAYFIPPGTVSNDPLEKSPNEEEIDSAVLSTCFMMKQYNIPSSQIFGHYQLMPGKPDPGEEFLAYFINRVENTCP